MSRESAKDLMKQGFCIRTPGFSYGIFIKGNVSGLIQTGGGKDITEDFNKLDIYVDGWEIAKGLFNFKHNG